jgi:putative membrane protein
MKRSMIALGCILAAGPALAQSIGERTGVNSALGISPTMADFIKEAANSESSVKNSEVIDVPV